MLCLCVLQRWRRRVSWLRSLKGGFKWGDQATYVSNPDQRRDHLQTRYGMRHRQARISAQSYYLPHGAAEDRSHVDNLVEFELRVNDGVDVLRGGENMTGSGESRNDVLLEASTPPGAAPLESILRTEDLRRRPSRPPDYEKENTALVALVGALADSPRTILQTLADKALATLHADSAGLSLLTKD